MGFAVLLRLEKGKTVVNDMHRRSLKAQMKEANKFKVKHVIIIGSEEIKNKEVLIKNMDSGNQQHIKIDKVNTFFK